MPEAKNPLLVLPKNGKDATGARNFLESFKQLCSTATIYEGPLKAMLDELGVKVDAALAALPTDSNQNWSVNECAEQLFSLLACANNVAATLGLELNKTKQTMAGLDLLEPAITAGTVVKKDAVQGLIDAAIAEATGENGKLVTKELSQQLCSASHQKGIQEGIAQRNAELAAEQAALATATERRTSLTTAGLPLPEEAIAAAILKSDAAAFDTAKATAEARLKKFTEAGIELPANLAGKVWLGEAEYKAFESTVMSIPALKKSDRVDEPLASGAPLQKPSSGKMIM